ncbi:hypothetical protein NDU88_005717 [Pleurodeles waltl]|uniref:Uncharacterized protein n=1 Tax=Pleurodeles waltl TaxID=8319 RepID=A0AAV7NN97_PLEWA|nr:hypothetical protein NDU88_005717 [Pleurodeles waltl]
MADGTHSQCAPVSGEILLRSWGTLRPWEPLSWIGRALGGPGRGWIPFLDPSEPRSRRCSRVSAGPCWRRQLGREARAEGRLPTGGQMDPVGLAWSGGPPTCRRAVFRP